MYPTVRTVAYSQAWLALKMSTCAPVPLMTAAEISTPASTARYAKNSVVLNDALVSVVIRRVRARIRSSEAAPARAGVSMVLMVFLSGGVLREATSLLAFAKRRGAGGRRRRGQGQAVCGPALLPRSV